METINNKLNACLLLPSGDKINERMFKKEEEEEVEVEEEKKPNNRNRIATAYSTEQFCLT